LKFKGAFSIKSPWGGSEGVVALIGTTKAMHYRAAIGQCR